MIDITESPTLHLATSLSDAALGGGARHNLPGFSEHGQRSAGHSPLTPGRWGVGAWPLRPGQRLTNICGMNDSHERIQFCSRSVFSPHTKQDFHPTKFHHHSL